MAEEKKYRELSPKEKMFCHYYLLGEKGEFGIGNGLRSYIKAYKENTQKNTAKVTTSYGTCAVEASRILKRPPIRKYLNELLVSSGFNDDAVDSRLREVIFDGKNQDSVRAIVEYNRLKKRVSDKLDIKMSIEQITGMKIIKEEDGNIPQDKKPKAV